MMIKNHLCFIGLPFLNNHDRGGGQPLEGRRLYHSSNKAESDSQVPHLRLPEYDLTKHDLTKHDLTKRVETFNLASEARS